MEFKYGVNDRDFDVEYCQESLSPSSGCINIEFYDKEDIDLDTVGRIVLYMTKTKAKEFVKQLSKSLEMN